MTDYPRLANIDIAALIGAADGNPWHVDHSLQCGDAGSISDLSRAFTAASVCTAETYREFEQAQARFDALRAWRAGVAREHNLPAYVIFHDATLAAIAARAPDSLADLQGVSGIGVAKLEKYGEAVLVVCRAGSNA